MIKEILLKTFITGVVVGHFAILDENQQIEKTYYCYYIHYALASKGEECMIFLRDEKDSQIEALDINDKILVDKENRIIVVPDKNIIIKETEHNAKNI